MKSTFVMLTFDLEEFDIPQEYGQQISLVNQFQVTLQGLARVLSVLDRHKIHATFFVTGHFADSHPDLIRHLSQTHEIASHALYHSNARAFCESDIVHSRRILEALSGQAVAGFRMPRLKTLDSQALRRWGFRYDSSINPTWLPGRYNMLRHNPLPSINNGLIELPCSTTPWLRFPLFWLSFKNLPLNIYTWLCRLTLKKRGNLTLYFHPWEFADLRAYKLPFYVKRTDSGELSAKLARLVRALKKRGATFVTCGTFCDQWEAQHS